MQTKLREKDKKIVALMPLRGGSKSIPYKNVKKIGGRPLFYWSMKSALDSKVFDRVYVSTDDGIIEKTVKDWFSEVVIIDRPKHLATDTASTESVMLHFCEHVEFDVIALVQATSPLTTAMDFRKAWMQFEKEKLDSLVTGVEWKRFFWSRDGRPVNYELSKRPRRQEMQGWIMENGAFYFTRRKILMEEQCRLGGKIGVFEMNPNTALEIDEPSDWEAIEKMLERRKGVEEKSAKIKKIKAVVLDVDGTLTDGGMYYGKDGEYLKRFNTKDAHGLKKLESVGIEIWIITAEDSPSVHSRMKKLGFKEYHFGIKEKLVTLNDVCARYSVGFDEIAYVGDDEGDLECIERCGFSACPCDAEDIVKNRVDYISNRGAGNGAVRDVCEMIYKVKNNECDR